MYKDDRLWVLKFQERMEQAKRYVKFCAKVYKFRIDNRRYFLHEHPRDQLGSRLHRQADEPRGCYESVDTHVSVRYDISSGRKRV